MKNISTLISSLLITAATAATSVSFDTSASNNGTLYTACEYEWVGSDPTSEGSSRGFNFVNYHKGDIQCRGPIIVNGHRYTLVGQWSVWR
ncbi:MAG: hypothetical protein AAGJ17_01950 [Pseudomonadota bacterium]